MCIWSSPRAHSLHAGCLASICCCLTHTLSTLLMLRLRHVWHFADTLVVCVSELLAESVACKARARSWRSVVPVLLLLDGSGADLHQRKHQMTGAAANSIESNACVHPSDDSTLLSKRLPSACLGRTACVNDGMSTHCLSALTGIQLRSGTRGRHQAPPALRCSPSGC